MSSCASRRCRPQQARLSLSQRRTRPSAVACRGLAPTPPRSREHDAPHSDLPCALSAHGLSAQCTASEQKGSSPSAALGGPRLQRREEDVYTTTTQRAHTVLSTAITYIAHTVLGTHLCVARPGCRIYGVSEVGSISRERYVARESLARYTHIISRAARARPCVDREVLRSTETFTFTCYGRYRHAYVLCQNQESWRAVCTGTTGGCAPLSTIGHTHTVHCGAE